MDSILNNYNLGIQGREKPGTKEARDERQRPVEGESMPENGPSDFLYHV